MKTFWLSFTDPSRPPGQRFLGVCVVDVTDADAALARIDVAARHPQAQPGAEWIAAAMTKAWREGCNPGGNVGSTELPAAALEARTCPRNVLMSHARLVELDLVDA